MKMSQSLQLFGGPVSAWRSRLQVPFTFDGKIKKITLDINRPKLSDEDIRKLEEARKSKGS
jgi:hypothetical protein